MKRQILLEYSNADFKKWANDSELVARFRELKSRIPAGKPEADIGFWIKNKQPEDLARFLDELVRQAAEKTAKRDKAREGARLIYDKNGWRCYHVTSYEAAAHLGRGTRWCITGRYEGHESRGQYYFNSYLESNYKAYYFLFQDNFKGAGKFPDNKWAICIHKYDDGCDIWQADDKQISVILREVPSDIPEIPQVGAGRMFKIEDGVVQGSFDRVRLDGLEGQDIGQVVVALGAHTIGDNAFTFRRGLDGTLSTDGLSSIGKIAFASTALTDVNIAKDTTYVGEKCFKGCKSLDYLQWDSTAPILNETFAACTSLNVIDFYSMPSDIAANAFANCPGIDKIFLPCSLADCPENIRKVFESLESQPEIRERFRSWDTSLEEDIRDAVTQTSLGQMVKLVDVYKNDQAREACRRAAALDKSFSNLGDIDLHNSDYRVAKSLAEVKSTPYYNIRVVLPVGTVTTSSGFDVNYPVLVLRTQYGAECGSGYSDLSIEVGGQFKYIDALTHDQLIRFAWKHGAIFIVEEREIDPKLRKERQSNLGAYPRRYDRKFFDGDGDADAADSAIKIGYADGPTVNDAVLPRMISFQQGLGNIRYKNFEKTLNAATHALRKERQRLLNLQRTDSDKWPHLELRLAELEGSLNALKDIKAKLRYFESAVDLLTAGLQDINGVVSPNRDRSLGSYIKLNRARAAANDEYNDALKDWDQAKAIDFLDTKVRRVGEVVNYITQVAATLERRVEAQARAEDDLETTKERFNNAKADLINTLNMQIEKASAEVDDYNKQIQDLLKKVKTKRNQLGLKEDIRDAVGKNGVSLTKALDQHNSKYSGNWYDSETDDQGRKIDYHRSEYVPITPEEAFKIVKGTDDGYKRVKAVLPVNGKSRLVALARNMHEPVYGSDMLVPDYMNFTTPKGVITGNTNQMLNSSEGLMHILKLAHEYGGLWKATLVPRDSETAAKRAQNPESPNFEDSAFDFPRGSNKEITKRHNATPYGNFDKGSFKRRMDSYSSDLKTVRLHIERATQNLEAAKQLDDNAMPPRENRMAAAQWGIVHYTEELEAITGRLVWIMEDLMAYKNEAARRRYYDSEKQLQQNIGTYKSITKKRAKAITRRRSAETTLDGIVNAQPGDWVSTEFDLYDISVEFRRAQKAVKLAEKKVMESRADLENFEDLKPSLPRMSQQEINDLFRKVNDRMAEYMELEAEMNDFLGKE